MASTANPTVFLSHSHDDKSVARRLVRRLGAHGIRVWIDELELAPGASLTTTIQEQIKAADMLLVVASSASAASAWTRMEIEFARALGKPIIPLLLDPVARHEPFRDHLGVDATSPQRFADVVDGLTRSICQTFDVEVPPVDREALEAGLRELAVEEPRVAPLIQGCLDSGGLRHESTETVLRSPFHPLDEALNALFDLMPNDDIAHCAALGFRRAGAGARALFSWIAQTRDGGLPLVDAVGTERLASAQVTTALALLAACDPPNNHALYQFIHHNSSQLDDPQRLAVLRLVTWPVRADPSRDADVLAFVALEHFPDAAEVQRMLGRWIRSGGFDGAPSDPCGLAGALAEAHERSLPGWETINEELRGYVRACLRSGDEERVETALDHIQAAADAQTPILASLLREAKGVSASAEWKKWSSRDADAAERMRWLVHMTADEAGGERNWERAREEAEKLFEFQRQGRQRLRRASPEENGSGHQS